MYFFGSRQTQRRRYTLRRELEVLDGGPLQLNWEERKAFFEEALGEPVRGEVRRRWEEAWEAEGTDWLGEGR